MIDLIKIHFDGGCKPTNPGNKYGSYEVVVNGRSTLKASRIDFGWGTSNEAEFNSLRHALSATVSGIEIAGLPFEFYRVQIYTDSTMVVGRIQRKNLSHKSEPQQRMFNLAQECLKLLFRFKCFDIYWVSRSHNVKRFGH